MSQQSYDAYNKIGSHFGARVVVAQLDFNTTFITTKRNAVYRTLEPDADTECQTRIWRC